MLQNQKVLILGLLISTIIGICNCRPVGFSYAKFSGPVSGPEKEIYVKDEHGNGYIDYIQKPDYSFAYGVDDPKTRVLQNRKESRHGDAVKGEYSVVDPDGTLRVVKYTADKKNGFQAEVITDGKSQLHGQDLSPHTQQQHHVQTQYHPPPQQQPQPYQPTEQEHDYYNHHEEPETVYHQEDDRPQTAAYTSHTRHPPTPPQNTQYHQAGYSGEENEDDYDDGGESGEEDDEGGESGEDDDEEEEEEEDDE